MTGPTGEEEPPACLGGCGKRLTSPESLARGYGKDCWRKLHGRPVRRPRASRRPRPAVSAPAVEPIPGQVELPLVDHQPTLWSI